MVQTSSGVLGAGTDANVYVELYGEWGTSGQLHLKDSETFPDPFENGQLDEFTFTAVKNLGKLSNVKVWHDNAGK